LDELLISVASEVDASCNMMVDEVYEKEFVHRWFEVRQVWRGQRYFYYLGLKPQFHKSLPWRGSDRVKLGQNLYHM